MAKARKKASAKKKTTAKKAARKKTTPKKSASKKATPKKTSLRKNKLGVKNSLVNNVNAKKKKGTSKSKKTNYSF